MAYAMLAPLPPVYGLYTSVVPILIYCLFGTSRHMHTGTFAITSLLLGQAVRGLMAKDGSADILTSNDYSLASTLLYDSAAPTPIEDPEYEQRFIGMILMLSFVVGGLQVILSFLRVGGWASKHLLPDALVGGFNTAAVFHIGTSQLKHFLGFKSMPSPQGAFALIKSWIWIGENFWAGTNWYTVGLGSIAILMMLAMRKVEKKRKAAFELKLRKEEMFLVQQRQAVSTAIVRNHEEQRELQRQWQQQQQQKGGDAGVGSSTSQQAGGPLSPYQDSSSNQAASASNISLRTVAHEGDDTNRPGTSISFAPAATTATTRTPGQVEQALNDPPAPVASAKDRPVYIPIPDILMAVIILTIVNVVFSLDTPRSNGGMGIAVIGSIPKGLPQMAFPANLISSGPKEWLSLEFLQRMILPMVQPALLIAVIIFVMSFSIAKQFGKRYGYKVDANQEMMALGLASMGGSIFSGYACTGSLTRTAILAQSGGKTPLASIVGVITVILTLVSLTWCFERVPNTVLAAIVLVALQSLVMQITEPLKLWRLGQRKASVIWTTTFLGVLIISVELGIAIGIAVVLLATAFGWTAARYRGEDNSDRDALLQRQRRRSSTAGRRWSQGAVPDLDASTRRAEGPEDATESLLNHSASASSANGLASTGAGGGQQQRRRPHGSGVHLSAPASPAADWKLKMMRTKWGQRIGSFLGLERPIFTDSLHANTDDDEY
jgi:MFS superfamily sulfate permease-like transporter